MCISLSGPDSTGRFSETCSSKQVILMSRLRGVIDLGEVESQMLMTLF